MSVNHYYVAKRAMDLLIASFGLLITIPLFLIVGFWIKIHDKGPIFYRGKRIGKNGKPFEIVKFRSMIPNARNLGGPTTAADDSRLTRPGRFIRQFNIDELPQLINVLNGEMSLVGPRPDVPSEVKKLTEEERELILQFRPGMTDWASIRFDVGATVNEFDDPHRAYEEIVRPEKIRLQKEYCRQASLKTDITILVKTVYVTLVGR